ncbi:Clp protease N-terminal domain-containing protein [Streptomyces aidingensis]|uniref:Clp amino terminal domain-containing protein, pathogenicity island component n=1 Tax=Streptomyces aidingensis TaxID=910347 RepID=A0A1I1PXW1_9ACTN|nr:Clp protease N-terminal domain-containing protein [Streptomyces aidingensis]SFD14669.1 Clp amino terminal domain-containing protein, pathogenicity island component [Streptomyces aidingensis]
MIKHCAEAGRFCGTPSGWRRGGRCPRCRTAHNAETGRYRGMTLEQRRTVLDALRAGSRPEAAADGVGLPVARLGAQASRDGELRAALDGYPEEVQQAARVGDYLAALTRTAGDAGLAAYVCGLSDSELEDLRGRPGVAQAEAAVVALLTGAARETSPSWKILLTADRVAQLRELWADRSITVLEIGKTLGASDNTVWQWARQLGLPPRAKPPGARFAESRERLEELLEEGRSVTEMARELGVSDQSVLNWIERIGATRPGRAPRQQPVTEGEAQQAGELGGPRSRPATTLDQAMPRLRELWADGARVRDIAAELGVTPVTVHRWAAKAELPPRRSGRDSADARRRLGELWADPDRSPTSIAEELGISRVTVHKWAQEEGLPPRQAARRADQLDKVAEMWADQERTVRSIAAELGVALPTLRRRVAELGLPPRRARRMPKLEQSEARLRALWADGRGIAEIAEELGVTRETVTMWVLRLGLPTR